MFDLERGVFDKKPWSSGCDEITLISKSEATPNSIFSLVTSVLASVTCYQGSTKASGIMALIGT